MQQFQNAILVFRRSQKLRWLEGFEVIVAAEHAFKSPELDHCLQKVTVIVLYDCVFDDSDLFVCIS